MKAQLIRLHSPDAPDLASFRPADPACFGLLVQAMIGPKGLPGEESFDFLVCTPAWLEARLREEPYRSGRHHLIVRTYDLAKIEAAIAEICARAEGPDWRSVAEYLARFGAWEFEDYRESDSA